MMSEYRHRQDDLENMLLTELASEIYHLKHDIRELVALGVNPNAVEGTGITANGSSLLYPRWFGSSFYSIIN